MPELPEVEILRRALHPLLAGARILAVAADPSPKYATALLGAGAVVTGVRRRGKYLLLDLDSGDVQVVHLGMTGQLHVDAAPADHVRVTWETDAGDLHLRDARRFGRAVHTAPGRYAGLPTLAALGPDPLEEGFDPADAAARLTASPRPVKELLLGQRALAGVGNYLADESLHRAGLHPAAAGLDASRARALVDAVCEVMAESLDAGGVSMRDYLHLDGSRGRYAEQLRVYGLGGRPCPRCGTVLSTCRVAGRGTTYCPSCQTS